MFGEKIVMLKITIKLITPFSIFAVSSVYNPFIPFSVTLFVNS